MMKIEKVYPRDFIALIVLVFSLFLIAKGINAIVSGIVIMIVTYYFSKRTYEERNPNGNLNRVIEQLGLKINNNNHNINIPKPLNQRQINKEFEKTKEILGS